MNYLEMMNKYDEPDFVSVTKSSSELVQFFESDFWTHLINKETKSLKDQGKWDEDNMELNYRELQNKISSLLKDFDLPELSALEDGFSPEGELEILKKLKSYLINE